MRAELCGVLNLNKPSGMTSRAAVDLIAKPLKGIRVGHAGTLDPLASGVLVVCVGAATRLIEYVQRMPKTYRAVVRLGARSDTDDAEGNIVPVAGGRLPSELEVRDALAMQVGTIEQRPPEYSAIKVGGRRSYKLARAGEAIELAARPVTIHAIEVLAYSWPRIELVIECGAGTYIRSIARDLGEQLGCGGLIEVLIRTRIGHFAIENALDPRSIDPPEIAAKLLPAHEALGTMPRMILTDEQVDAVGHGKAVEVESAVEKPLPSGEVALIAPDGAVVAIAEATPQTGRLSPRRVLLPR